MKRKEDNSHYTDAFPDFSRRLSSALSSIYDMYLGGQY